MGIVDRAERQYQRAQDAAGRFDARKPNGDGRHGKLRLTWPKDYGPATAPRCVVEGLLESGTLAEIFGESNSGKSTLALDLALTVAQGEHWRDRRTIQGLVVYLALESAAGLRRRVRAYEIRHQLEPLGNFCDISESVTLLQSVDLERVLVAIREAEATAGSPCLLLVVDTLARALTGGDENDGRDMGELVAACDRIRHETGATVLIIHHSGKDTSRGARGHSSLRAAVDTEVEVTGQANPRQARVTKQRDLPSGNVFAFDLEPVEIGENEETGEPITACVVAHRDDLSVGRKEPRAKSQMAILRALRNRQAEAKETLIWTVEEMRRIGRELGQHKGTARSAVDALFCSGLLVPTIGGYRLAECEG